MRNDKHVWFLEMAWKLSKYDQISIWNSFAKVDVKNGKLWSYMSIIEAYLHIFAENYD